MNNLLSSIAVIIALCIPTVGIAHGGEAASRSSARTEGQGLDSLANMPSSWAVEIGERYNVLPNIVYSKANNFDLLLDVYRPKPPTTGHRPTLINIHGGGWLDGATKDSEPLLFLPFLQLGWVVVNVDYRPSSVSLAPAAVEDCLCALRWIGRHGADYDMDTSRVVLMGHSAGGHLALTTGMIPLSNNGLGAPCALQDMYGSTTDVRYPPASIRVAAIINWYGITNVVQILEGPEQQGYAVKWLGNQPNVRHIAEVASPITYVRAGVPPIVTVHGTNDRVVPYHQATELHNALSHANVPNMLISIPDAGHGGFKLTATKDAYTKIFNFLRANGVLDGSE